MAQANVDLIDALRQTARRIESGSQTGFFITDKKAIRQWLNLGLTQTDLQQLQNLSDPEVLAQLAGEEARKAPLAAQYLRAWANLLENELLAELDLPVDIRYLQIAA